MTDSMHRWVRPQAVPYIVHADYDNQGFTLIEVLIAIAILSFGLLAIASMQFNSIRKNAEAQKISIYGAAAQTRIELLMSAPYNDVTAGLGLPNRIDYGGYYLEWTAANEQDLDGDGINDAVDVSVVVFTENPPADDPRNGERFRLCFLKFKNF